MPVAQQPSQQHHHHLFSAIGTFLHAFQPSSHHSTPNSSSSGASSPLSSHDSSELSDLYQTFESHLAQRLSTLLPAADSPLVSLPSLKELMGLLLDTQTDLRTFVPRKQKQTRSMEEFLERSTQLLDVCRGIKEQMLEMESLQGMLDLVIFCLNLENGDLIKGRVNRARKALAQLIIHMEVEREDHTEHAHNHRSFRERLRERLSRESAQHRWKSWHRNHLSCPSSQGSAGSASSFTYSNHAPAHSNSSAGLSNMAAHGNHVSVGAHAGPPQTLHTLELSLLPPKLPPKDGEECFSATLYALNVLSVFSLGTISAAFPHFGNAHYAVSIQPSHLALWATPFLRLQEKVDEELRMRSKKGGGYAVMWELDQIYLLGKTLFELISSDEVLERDEKKEDVKKVAEIFGQHVEKLRAGMGSLQSQINEYYNRVVKARMGVLDMLSDAEE